MGRNVLLYSLRLAARHVRRACLPVAASAGLAGCAPRPFCKVRGWQASPACNGVAIAAGFLLGD